MSGVSRRSLLQAIATAIGAATLAPEWLAVADAAHRTHGESQGADRTLSVFTAADAADVEAVAAQIVPADDTPGAREAGAVYFIDRALATVLAQVAGDYRGALAEFQSAFRARHPGTTSFALLAPDQQVEYLATVDRTPFFEATRMLTLLGMFSHPSHGGNRDGIGWKLMEFEDRHFFQPPFGFYDRDYPGFVVDRKAP